MAKRSKRKSSKRSGRRPKQPKLRDRVAKVAKRMDVHLPDLKGLAFGRGVEVGGAVVLTRRADRYGRGESWTVRRRGTNVSLVGLPLPDALLEVQYMLGGGTRG